MIAALLLLQAAVAPAVTPERFSVLVDPCASASNDGGDVVVCGRPEKLAPRLPLPQYRGVPDHPVASNPYRRPEVALNGPGVGAECGAYGEGCPVGGGGYALPKLLGGATGLVKSALARHPDKRGRVAIDLDAPTPTAGRVSP